MQRELPGIAVPDVGRDADVAAHLFFHAAFFLATGIVGGAGTYVQNPIINLPVRFYILVLRGTPLMLQLLFIFYGLKPIFGIQLDRVISAQVAFALNYAAYFAEIFRGGIEGIPQGQHEAAKVLGFTKKQTFFRIVLPQVVKRIIPPMGNEFITLVKDTSLAQAIGVVELLRITENWVSSAVDMTPFLIAGIFYLVMNGIVTRCFTVAEKRLSYYR